MTYNQAKKRADKYTKDTGKGAFVYFDDDFKGGYGWISEMEYYTIRLDIREDDIIYSTIEGEYC